MRRPTKRSCSHAHTHMHTDGCRKAVAIPSLLCNIQMYLYTIVLLCLTSLGVSLHGAWKSEDEQLNRELVVCVSMSVCGMCYLHLNVVVVVCICCLLILNLVIFNDDNNNDWLLGCNFCCTLHIVFAHSHTCSSDMTICRVCGCV